MINISFDILADLQVKFLPVVDLGYTQIQSDQVNIRPSPSTLRKLRQAQLLFKQIGGVGHILGSPEEDGSGIKLTQALTLSFYIYLKEPTLSRLIDWGPDLSKSSSRGRRSARSLEAASRNFYLTLFPGRRPLYFLDNKRLTEQAKPVGQQDIISPMGANIQLSKEMYKSVSMRGPFTDTEVPQIVSETQFEYDLNRLSEGMYQIEVVPKGKKALKGRLFHLPVVPTRPPIAIVSISLEAKTYPLDKTPFSITFQEKTMAQLASNNT